MSLNEIYDSGYVAAENGVQYYANPYQHGSAENEAWRAGYECAMHDYNKQVADSHSDGLFMTIVVACCGIMLALMGIGAYTVIKMMWGVYVN